MERFCPNGRVRSKSEPVRILCVARLIEQKGLTYLLKACSLLKEMDLAFQCRIIGCAEDIFMNYYVTLKKLHRNLFLEDCVEFSGTLPFHEIIEAYEHSDIFVLPCIIAKDGSRDIIPNSLLEATAMQLPVISTKVTGVPD